MRHDIIILGVFMADTTYRAPRLPKMGETLRGDGFALGPGGKGSNQAVAAAKAGGKTGFVTRIGADSFGQMAQDMWQAAGVASLAIIDPDKPTGAACVMIDSTTGDNAIIIAPGSAEALCPADLMGLRDKIEVAKVFLAQLEQPIAAAEEGLRIARGADVTTILNPAPAAPLSDELLGLCDWITPNETEAELLTGLKVTDPASATKAAEALIKRGVGGVVVTLGGAGALVHDGQTATHIPAIHAGDVAETTGAGDAFNGGFAAALADGLSLQDALRFATATAALSVTRQGAAASMPERAEIDALLALQE